LVERTLRFPQRDSIRFLRGLGGLIYTFQTASKIDRVIYR
jgi:hypothetical protein